MNNEDDYCEIKEMAKEHFNGEKKHIPLAFRGEKCAFCIKKCEFKSRLRFHLDDE